jgi:hypothetical protein
MNPEEQYHLDVSGFLVVKGALFADEVAWCNQQLDTEGCKRDWPELYEHPILAAYVHELCGEDYYLDQPIRPLDLANGETSHLLTGGNEPLNWSRAYHQQNEVQLCQGLVAVWALTDVAAGDGGFHLVPASHKSWVETPLSVRDGGDDMGLMVQPVLAAGDLLLCAASTLHGMRPWSSDQQRRLLACRFLATEARRSLPEPEANPLPAWITELPPAARAIATPFTGGPTPTVHSDGLTCTYEENGEPFHPSIYIRNLDPGIDEREFYHWDLCGHLVLRGVMDAVWLAAANAAIEANTERIHQGSAPHKGSRRLKGTPLASLTGLFELPQPHCEPFRAMIAHPTIVQRLNWMMGSGFRLGPVRAMCYAPGSSGLFLHGGGEPANSRNHYALQNGRTQCESVNVA